MSSFKLNKKKSRLQMHRAEEERKRLEAAAEVEAVYADFVDSFDVDDPGDKAFVRAGTMEGGKFSQSGEPESKKRYVPGGGSSSSTKKKKGGGFGGIDLSAMGGVAKKTKKGKEPSQRELFLQEMKREQQDRDARLAGRKAGGGKFAMGDRPPGGGSLFDVAPPLGYNAGSGSHTDTGDNTTTNLYVGNIPPTVTEDILWRQFSVYGAIASVKIMWPRTDEERARNRNCGFVQYMERQAAERGKNAMDGTKLEEFEMVRPVEKSYGALLRAARRGAMHDHSIAAVRRPFFRAAWRPAAGGNGADMRLPLRSFLVLAEDRLGQEGGQAADAHVPAGHGAGRPAERRAAGLGPDVPGHECAAGARGAVLRRAGQLRPRHRGGAAVVRPVHPHKTRLGLCSAHS